MTIAESARRAQSHFAESPACPGRGVPVRLTIGSDGSWAIRSGLDSSTGIISGLRGGALVLDGQAGAEREAGVWLRLQPTRDGALVGLAHTHFSRHTVVTNVHLWRTDPARAPASR
jgi:hypothetical protein